MFRLKTVHTQSRMHSGRGEKAKVYQSVAGVSEKFLFKAVIPEVLVEKWNTTEEGFTVDNLLPETYLPMKFLSTFLSPTAGG